VRRSKSKMLTRKGSALLAILSLFIFVSLARGEEEELQFLELYNGPAVDVVSADRSPRPASQTAENITVVTAKEIAALNAHTLADVLYTISGVQIEYLRTPGTLSTMDLQGANFNHLLVLVDNVPINNLGDNFPDIALIPAQIIERVEVVKGAASSSWGSALGGVINVITKTPQTERPFNGLVTASIGSRTTLDARGDVTGTVDRFGYYLSGGKLRSDGLLPNNAVDENSFYSKLHYELPVHGSISATTSLIDNVSGQLQFRGVNVNEDVHQILATVSADYPLTDRLTLDAGYRARRATNKIFFRLADSDALVMDSKSDESLNGAVFKLSWIDELQKLVLGVDYDHVWSHVSQPVAHVDVFNATADRVGVYLNDTFTFGRFAITPSGRFDHTETSGDLFSPGFGITYALTDNTVLRGYTAKGYSLVTLNRDNPTEKVWTSQVGVESADIPYLWVKGTLFRNDTWNIQTHTAAQDGSIVFGTQSQLKQGVELEARTIPVFNTSLSLGYTFTDATDGDTDATIKGVAKHLLNIGVKYEDSRHLRALLFGHYVDWNAKGTPLQGDDDNMIWDVFLGKKFSYSETTSVELFFSARNIFNGNQYLTGYNNPRRWFEGGVKCAF
jgi:vitamin B12 transporter